MNYFLAFSLLPLLSSHILTSALQCKVTPDSPKWPSEAAWKALNTSVAGKLIKPVAPGAVCHSDQPSFSNASCEAFQAQWTNSSFHLTNPASVDYNDVTCFPSPTAPCSTTGYPAYVIAATGPQDVQVGAKFAKQTGVRLIVKGTGHDLSGR